MTDSIDDNNQQWYDKLTSEQFQVCRLKSTEAPFSGKYYNCQKKGVYHCVCCHNPLFDSAHKYNSGSGWPSFWQTFTPYSVTEVSDQSLGMLRTEVLCHVCGSHLGHVFNDGPLPTGLRYCINSIALELE